MRNFIDNQSLIQKLNLYERLQAHSGCVNTITWSDDDPRYILSGSDDQCLSITDAFSGLVSQNFQFNLGDKKQQQPVFEY